MEIHFPGKNVFILEWGLSVVSVTAGFSAYA